MGIYEEFSGLILAYAAQRTADPQDAADVVADTFVVAWRRIDEVPAGDEARPWLLAAGFVKATPAEGPDIERVAAAFEALSPARELSKVGVQRAGEAGHGPGRWATARPYSEEP